jgi:hypothetical protein
MATTQKYYWTYDEAFGAFCDDLASVFVAGTTTSGFSAGWTAASGSTPGFILYKFSSSLNLIQYNVLESVGVANFPLRYLISGTNFNKSFEVSGVDPSGSMSFVNLVSLVVSVRDQAVTQLTGYSLDSYYSTDHTYTGLSKPGRCIRGTSYWTANDASFGLASYVNGNYLPTVYGLQYPIVSVFPANHLLRVAGAAVVNVNLPTPSPQMDVDVAVNQGQAILSVLSRTTTMIP